MEKGPATPPSKKKCRQEKLKKNNYPQGRYEVPLISLSFWANIMETLTLFVCVCAFICVCLWVFLVGFLDYLLHKLGYQFIIYRMSWLHKLNPGEFDFTMNTMTALLKVQPVSSASKNSDLPHHRWQIIHQGAGRVTHPSFSINHGD